MSVKQNLPAFGEIRFSCPSCGALAHQYWGETRVAWHEKDKTPERYDIEKLSSVLEIEEKKAPAERHPEYYLIPEYIKLMEGQVFAGAHRKDPYSFQIYNLDISRCDSCGDLAIWLNERMIHPAAGPGALPNEDMPREVRRLFEEAGAVFSTSPRASAALLRLALQVLLEELGETNKDIFKNIESLSKKGLPSELVKIMHSLRIIGNESVHPGEISVDDEPYMAEAMFGLINQVVEQLITRPREQQELWEMLPESKTKPVQDKLKQK